MHDQQKKRRWQFSIRDVLLIMLIVGLAAGWFVDHRRLADELARQQQQQNWIWLPHLNYQADLRKFWNDSIGRPAEDPLAVPDPTATDPLATTPDE